MGNRILFVDDERAILKAIERLFFDTDYEIVTADSGEAGLRILAEEQVDVVVSDIRMPGMDGHQFLRKVKTLYPATTRLILSGYAEENAILNSIVDGSSNMYLLKPWDGQELKNKIKQIFETREIFKSSAFLDMANKLENIAVAPGIYNSVAGLIERGSEIGQIAAIVETDPTISAAVLRVANSAFYNVKTGSVAKAITFLGLNATKAIVLSCSLFKFANIRIPPFNVKRLALHASSSNRLLHLIYSQLLKKQLPESHQAAGLLSNVGFLICLHYFPDKYDQIVRAYVSGKDKNAVKIEKEYLGITHQEVGGYLLNWWGLPYPIVEAALFHHEPLNSAIVNKEVVAVVNITNHYAWKQISPELAPNLDPEVFAMLGVSKDDCERLIKDVGQQI
ncbi:HDOD domain-containing protein [Sporomusa malonica]|uniref:DNA-binding transcriptional response regulator, NtrC family, contains REC, AAA-type ATPase, and a Fis-type DNA-binding domains n=1 Tax=Sporomusa malonica TaxID=112901 RepID=A0A1W2DYP1_9FIRM|nr:HDOD domain-containing protein [Sporomusa malonica]SMD02641.1 DNA-binding transcriptional response regulator, NtrC family, contains REC, AAA-type ATPase, and a Fis-type DNA-binding domains [Sporomusa malonica]